ncbi:MAG: sulfite exporter TauE/SafE family protein [Clostridia bacterium]
MGIIYFLICIVSTTIGAISGIGGGVIIKPVLDMISVLDVSLISFFSGCTVLAMSSYSLISSRTGSVKVESRRGTLLAAGGVIGGIGGKYLFDIVNTSAGDSGMISIVQNTVLGILTLAVFFYMLRKNSIKGYDIQNAVACVLIGVFLGAIGAFLGIGGGPINLIVLYYFFSMDTKLAALTSIYIIFFSQLASLALALIQGVPSFDPVILVLMILGGIGGGIIGRKIAKAISEKATDNLFTTVLFVIMIICIYNIIKSCAI